MSPSKGISGILDQIVGVNDARQPPSSPKSCPPANDALQTQHCLLPGEEPKHKRSIQARRGRPLGTVHSPASRHEPKAKVTLWISQNLIDQYRDWSWEARCPLSALVERAMEKHRNCR
jgi:hypothetical protein